MGCSCGLFAVVASPAVAENLPPRPDPVITLGLVAAADPDDVRGEINGLMVPDLSDPTEYKVAARPSRL